MYSQDVLGSTAPVVVTTGTVAVLPSTGADFITSAALAVAAGLVTWGVVYFVKVVRH